MSGAITKIRKCKRCGRCCKAEVCEIGLMTGFKSADLPCPALIVVGGKNCCGFVLAEKNIEGEPLITKALGIGMGCDSDFEY